jgi:hypothetical protein
MSKIKSALEIALERTQDIKSDKKILHVNNMKDEGKKLISEYLKMNSDLERGSPRGPSRKSRSSE